MGKLPLGYSEVFPHSWDLDYEKEYTNLLAFEMHMIELKMNQLDQ